MKKLLIACVFAGFTLAASAQASPGTYQLMTTMPKAQEFFTSELLLLIEENRDMDELVILKVGEFTWVRILSGNTISDSSFTPLPEGTIEIDPNDPLISDPTLIKD